ncbi:MAG: DUF922 domain-containing protein [Alphaproteobacteria bacterium]
MALISAAPVLADVRSTLVKRDYYVGGTTPRSLVNFMKTMPHRGHRGAAFASIIPSYQLDLRTRRRGNTCRVTRADLKVRFVLTLPKAREEARMSRSTRNAWRNFVNFAKRHEEKHRRIYLNCAQNFVAKARRVKAPDCFSAQNEVRRLQMREQRTCDRRNTAFDSKEYKRVARLTLFRRARR